MEQPRQPSKLKPPGLFIPVIDRTRCEGGFHHECKEKQTPCVPACPNSVLEIKRLSSADKKGLPFGEKLRIFVHGNKQSFAVKPEACTCCGLCVKACPSHAIKLKRSAANPS